MVGKRCFVPFCYNTSNNKPQKVFLNVPKDPERRKLWFEAVGRPEKILPKTSSLFCCEDHFDLENDTENWLFYSTLGKKLTLKNYVVPRRMSLSTEPQIPDSARKRKEENLDKLYRAKSCSKKLIHTETTTSFNTEPPTPFDTEASTSFDIEPNLEILCQTDSENISDIKPSTSHITPKKNNEQSKICISSSGPFPVQTDTTEYKRAKLKEDAIPRYFPDCPNLSKNKNKERNVGKHNTKCIAEPGIIIDLSTASTPESTMTPVNLRSLYALYEDKKVFLEQLQDWKLIPRIMRCRKCRGKLTLYEDASQSDGWKWRCANRPSNTQQTASVCNHTVSFRTGTFFARSKLSLLKILCFAHLWIWKVPSYAIQVEVEITRTTYASWASMCQDVLIKHFEKAATETIESGDLYRTFLKKCAELKQDRTVAFFHLAGEIHDATRLSLEEELLATQEEDFFPEVDLFVPAEENLLVLKEELLEEPPLPMEEVFIDPYKDDLFLEVEENLLAPKEEVLEEIPPLPMEEGFLFPNEELFKVKQEELNIKEEVDDYE